MRYRLAVFTAAILVTGSLSAANVPSPGAFLNLDIGADRVLADYHQIRSYFEALDEASDRVQVEVLGKTTLGEPMIMAVISSEENIANLTRIREISTKLSDPRKIADDESEQLIREGKAIVLVTCNIHSTEIGSSQMSMEWAYSLASATDEKRTKWLDDVVLLLVPSLNPDGQIMVTDWYGKYVGTKYEGGPMPWLYHHYVGHDNNRDWFMLTQKETRALTRALYHRWFPQIFVDHHQMGSTGPRMFIPPFSDPLDPDPHPLIWREVQVVGSNMAFRLEQANKPGVIFGYRFDAYWMGGTRNTGWWKNVTGLLTETASARIASPIDVHPTELSGGGKGLIDYEPQVNFPNPWKGGVWRMRDIMDYQRIASDSLLETASMHREDLLRDLLVRSRSAIAEASRREAYFVPRVQHDYPTARRLAEIIADHGVDVFEAKNGDFWIPLDQPFSRFVREIMEPQRYPEIKLMEGDEVLAPYDVSTWSLPLLMGVKYEKRMMPFNLEEKKLVAPIILESSPDAGPLATAQLTPAPFYAIERTSAESAKVVNAILAGGGKVWVGTAPASDVTQAPVPVTLGTGTFYTDRAGADLGVASSGTSGVPLIPLVRLPEATAEQRMPRVGLYKPWSYPSMDEGWTRFVMDSYAFNSTSLDPGMVQASLKAKGKATLESRFDVIILPHIRSSIISTGKGSSQSGRSSYSQPYPPEFEGGLGKDGAEALKRFVASGGTVVAFDDSTDWVIDTFELPVTNVLARQDRSEFSSPGALLRALVDNGHPVTWGVSPEIAVFHSDSRAFATSFPGAEMKRSVMVYYPADRRDILLSGWIRGEDGLERRSAAVALEVGRGKIVLFGFRPQHRAQTHGTFSLVFNSIYWSALER